MKSYNEKYNASINTDSTNTGSRTLDNTDTLYVSQNNTYNGVNFYWLADEYPSNTSGVWTVYYIGRVGYYRYNYSYDGVHLVVSLPSSTRGTVGETIEIK